MVTDVSLQRQARLAGWVYLVLILAGGFGYFAGSTLIVRGDAAATAGNILASELSWRLGLASLLVMLVCDVVVAVLFYVLFAPVSRSVSLLGFALRLVMVAILGFNLLARAAPLLLLRDNGSLAALGVSQTQALAFFSLEQFEWSFTVALVFFGVDCLAIGWLIARSTFLPGTLGVLLVIGGLCYLANSFLEILAPSLVLPFDLLLPAYAAELALCLWLIVKGVDAERWMAQNGHPL